jgi:hypothetical protein
MTDAATSSAAAQAAVYGALINRRITIRRTASAAVAVSAKQPRSPFQKVRIHDISQGGIALVLRHAPAVGEMICLQMTNRLLGFTYDLAAEVRHAQPLPRGTWLVGLAFDRPLSLGEFAALV